MQSTRWHRRSLIIVTTMILTVSSAVCVAVVRAAGRTSDGIRLVADVDRDGVIDEAGRGDARTGSALVLPNIGVSSGVRCPDTRSTASDNQLEACHDAADYTAHAPQNLAPVRILPFTAASDRASGTLLVAGDPQGRIRVFRKTGAGWTFLKSGATLTAQDLRSGVELGVDSRDIVRDKAVWDGRFTLRLEVSDGDRTSSDSVPMAVAPLILHNHTERATALFVPRSADNADHKKFVRDLADAATKAGGVTLKTLATEDTWAQDFVEFGYVSMPGPGGTTRTIEIAIRSGQPGRVGGRAVFDLRGPGFGAVQTGGKGYHQVASFGNLETIPPYEHNGRSFPAGRIIHGDAGPGANLGEQALTVFASQGVQDPLKLDTSWLFIAHVDEFVQFLPADNPRGWTIAVADPRAGVELLRTTQAAGQGAVRAISHQDAPNVTVAQLLANQKFIAGNTEAAEAIERNLKILMDETGVKRDEVIGVPALFSKDALGFDGVPPGNLPPGFPPRAGNAANTYAPDRPFDAATAQDDPIEYGEGSFAAYLPGAVNGIVVDRTHYLAPKQWGPVVNGRDVFADAVEHAYHKVGMQAGHIDDYNSHHTGGGEIHCGSNAVRAVTKPWWTKI
jgi:protein-arginine deiminase